MTHATVQPDPVLSHLTWMRLRGLAPASITQRRRTLSRLRHALPVPLMEATADQLADWQARLRVSVPALANYTANIACFYRWLQDEGHRPDNPAARLPRPKVRKGIPRPIEEDRLALAIAGAPADVRCWLVLGAYAGLRAGEMSRLNRGDILDTAHPPVLIVQGKGGKQRIVPLSSRVLFELRAYGLPSRGFVFRRRDGNPGAPTPARVSQLVNGYLHEIGIDDTGHAARHRFGTVTYQLSKDIRLTQELLGHADPATTAGYAAFAAEQAAVVVEEVGKDQAGRLDLPNQVGRPSVRELHGLSRTDRGDARRDPTAGLSVDPRGAVAAAARHPAHRSVVGTVRD